MPKLTKAIYGVPTGEVFPRHIPAGEDCPANLEAYAEQVGALELPPEVDAPPTEPATAATAPTGDKEAEGKATA